MATGAKNLPVCKDHRGPRCFAMRRCINGKALCICLSDTATVPCPFFKTKEEAEKNGGKTNEF